ncbi:MAG: serine/threonine-protein kinase, partial [Sandaracinaceae bacterium]
MQPGDVIAGRFALEAEVARGGMGRLLRASDRHTGRPVALKVIATEDPSAGQRFAREAAALSKVSHPALVEHVAHGITPDGAAYLAMEWLEGQDLRGFLGTRSDDTLASGRPTAGFLAPGDALVLARRVASALAALHDQGIVHRDIKPANLFLVGGDVGQVKLLDLGAAAVHDARPLTMTGVLVGTPAYMAPEQVRAESRVGATADVWGLGCVLYECLTGTPAFRAQHVMALLAKILLDEPPSIHAARPDLPAPLLDVVQKTLEKDAAARFADGGALARALAELDVSQPTPAY